MTTRIDMIIETLRDNPNTRFTARELAKAFIQRYPDEMREKQQNPRYADATDLINQLAREIGGDRTTEAKQRCPNVATRDKPRPRLYYWDANPAPEAADDEAGRETESPDNPASKPLSGLSEHDLYPLLMDYLHEAMGLYCMRIDEHKSRNSYGNGGNQWLHPDIVAMEPLDSAWSKNVRNCVRNGNYQSVRLWSFEVKLKLTRGNVRKCFFQAVSNSSWSNFGYLVATEMADNVADELQMLSSLHGIGVLLLDTESLFDSQILLPAKLRRDVDWQSVDRIVTENSDFDTFIDQVDTYHQTRKLKGHSWNQS